MDHNPSRQISPRERVRKMGFDPDHLTPDEQRELLELDAVLSPGRGRRGLITSGSGRAEGKQVRE